MFFCYRKTPFQAPYSDPRSVEGALQLLLYPFRPHCPSVAETRAQVPMIGATFLLIPVPSLHGPILITARATGVSNLWPTHHKWPRVAMNAAQHKTVNLLKTFFFAHQFSLVFVYLKCGPRQLFFRCGPEMPKGWTLLPGY